MVRDPAFDVEVSTDESPPGERLLISVSNLGLAGLTAVDHLVEGWEATEIGHVRTENVPDVTPFEEGVPRLPVRLYAVPEFDLTVLVGELFVPAWAADPFAETVRAWAVTADVEEITVLHGVPYPHGPDDHGVFHVASPDYPTNRLTENDIAPLAGGFLDGVVGELITDSLVGSGPPVGALVTPTHPPGPDFDAALRFLEALEGIYGTTIDEAALRRRADEMRRQYRELATRLEQLESDDQPLRGRDFPDDRMFM